MTAPAGWVGFAQMIGGASGALTGLLFVSVSLNATRIAGHSGLRSSAAQTMVLFLTPLFMAAALLAPGQADPVLGAEFIAIGATGCTCCSRPHSWRSPAVCLTRGTSCSRRRT